MVAEELPVPPQQAAPPQGALYVVLLIVFVDLLGFGIILPQLPFFGQKYHTSDVQVGVVFAIYSLFQFLAAPVLGMCSDKFGRRPVLIFSQAGSAVGYLLLGLATQLNFESAATGLGLIYLARIIDGVSGGNISTAQAYISDVTTPATRARGMGLLGAAFGFGFAAGPALSIVVGNNGNRAAWPAFFAAFLSAAAAVLSYTRLPESHARAPVAEAAWLHPSRFLPILKQKTLAQLIAIGALAMTAFTMLEATIGLFLARNFTYGPDHKPYGQWQTACYFVYIGLWILYVQGRLMGQLVRRFGEWRVAIAGSICVAAAMAGYVLVGSHPVLWLLLIAGAINAIGRSLHGPPITTLVSKISDRTQQGTVFGLYQGLGSLSRAAGPMIATVLFQRLFDTAQFVVAGAIMAAVTLWLLALRTRATPAPYAFPAGDVALEGAPTSAVV